MESSVIFLWNDVLILIGKENKEATAICFEIRIPKKKNKELNYGKFHQKFMEVILLWKKQKPFLVCKYFQISSPKNGAIIFGFYFFSVKQT